MLNRFSILSFIGFILLRVQAIHASTQNLKNVVTDVGLRGVAELKKTVNALNNNVSRKISVTKHTRVGDVDVATSVRSADVDPYCKRGTQLIPVNVRRQGGLVNLFDASLSDVIDELKINASIELSSNFMASGSVLVDIPKTLEISALTRDQLFSRGFANFQETIRRVDFLCQHADWVMRAAYNKQTGEGTLELLKKMEDLYILGGKYVSVTPKVEVVYDKDITPDSNFCINLKRGEDSITPVIYPLTKKFELLAEKALTDELKAGFFWSKDNRLFMNLSLSLPWGKTGWQTIAFRFVFPNLEKSHVHMSNEVNLE
ncbi:hypothetical protein BgAZ_400570 [Babesia gibsoni]|uniref:Uncharacterized protein n=1 Tax=Babesia gibsoni TaxID=33632 RepID=A0AAD8LI71_BABGI|nr:hypothetical protein BgAZ_400570 [Babesia gibsoni]